MKRIFAIFQGSVFVKNSVVLFVGTMVMNALNYVFHFSVGRLVDAQTYGALQSLIALLAILSVPAAALTLIATKYGAVGKARGDIPFGRWLFAYLNKRIIKYGWPIVAVGLLLTPLVQTFLQIDDTVAVGLTWALAALTFFSSASVGILSGWQRFGTVNSANIAGAGTKLLLGIGAAYMGFGLDGIVWGLVIAGVVGYAVSVKGLRFLKPVSEEPSATPVETMQTAVDVSTVRGYVMTALVGTLGITALGNADIVLAKHALDPELAGAYGALAVVAKVIFFVTGVIATVLFSMSSESVEKNSNRQPQNFFVFWMALGLTVCVSVGAVVIYFLVPEFVLSIFFGDKYLAVAPMLGWFGLGAGLYAVVNLMLQQLLSMHMIRSAQWLCGIVAVEVAVLFFFGTSLFSIVAIVIATQIIALLTGFLFILKTCRMKEKSA